MKAKVKDDVIFLYAETKKEIKKLEKFVKENSTEVVIPKSIKKYAYYEIENIKIIIP